LSRYNLRNAHIHLRRPSGPFILRLCNPNHTICPALAKARRAVSAPGPARSTSPPSTQLQPNLTTLSSKSPKNSPAQSPSLQRSAPASPINSTQSSTTTLRSMSTISSLATSHPVLSTRRPCYPRRWQLSATLSSAVFARCFMRVMGRVWGMRARRGRCVGRLGRDIGSRVLGALDGDVAGCWYQCDLFDCASLEWCLCMSCVCWNALPFAGFSFACHSYTGSLDGLSEVIDLGVSSTEHSTTGIRR